MPKPIIVFDLDGTLLDCGDRLYRLFQQLVPESNWSVSDYWQAKRAAKSHRMLLEADYGYNEKQLQHFETQWMSAIEDAAYLELDTVVPGVREMLGQLLGRATLYVCTARQSQPLVYSQLESLELSTFFEAVFVTQQKASKQELLAESLRFDSSSDWMIGDTGKDIQVGKQLGIRTCAVANGFLSKEVLQGYSPDLLLGSAAQFSL